MKCNLEGREYRIFGYKGKQVRDNIHSRRRRARSSTRSIEAPRVGEVYNLGGGKANSCSILEAFELVEAVHRAARRSYTYVDENRVGDHICYYSDLRKMREHYPALGHHEDPQGDRERDRSILDRASAGATAGVMNDTGPRMRILISGVCGFVGSTLARTWVGQRGRAPAHRHRHVDSPRQRDQSPGAAPARGVRWCIATSGWRAISNRCPTSIG